MSGSRGETVFIYTTWNKRENEKRTTVTETGTRTEKKKQDNGVNLGEREDECDGVSDIRMRSDMEFDERNKRAKRRRQRISFLLSVFGTVSIAYCIAFKDMSYKTDKTLL